MEGEVDNADARRRAINLFEFLARAQRLKSKPVTTVERYRGDGQELIWFADLPEHPFVRGPVGLEEAEQDTALLTIKRIARHDPPLVPDDVERWLIGPRDNPQQRPELRESISEFSETNLDAEPQLIALDDEPAIRERIDDWLRLWAAWAEADMIDRPARELYNLLFGMRVSAETHIEELELVVGVALCAWSSDDGGPIQRHVFTSAAVIDFDEATGELSVRPRPDGLELETEMIDSGRLAHVSTIGEIKADAKAFEHSPLNADEIGLLARRLVYAIDPESVYTDDSHPIEPSTHLRASFAPALILRKRSQRGMIRVLDEIVDQLKAGEEVPPGILALVEPDAPAHMEIDETPGATIEIDRDPFLPMPVNERQLEVIRRVDRRARTLVQGPPGTGKTHTAAALISHLLAQGKRVLVTAHTDRALYELRGKLPEEIRPLSVSVVGAGRDDMAQLRTAVDTISGRAAEFDPIMSAADEAELLSTIDRQRRSRAGLYRRLLEVRESEIELHSHGGKEATLARFAWDNAIDAQRFGWVTEHDAFVQGSPLPFSNTESLELLALLRDKELATDEPEARLALVDLDEVPTPDEFYGSTQLESNRSQGLASLDHLASNAAIDGIRHLPPDERLALQERLRGIADTARDLEKRKEVWIEDALQDVLAGRGGVWAQREQQVRALAEPTAERVDELGALVTVTFGEGDRGVLGALARTVRTHVQSGKEIKTAADGSPKIGALTARVVKDAQALFAAVRVNGLPPTNDVALGQVELAIEIERALVAMEKAWPSNVRVPDEDTYAEQLQWHLTELEQLVAVLALSELLQSESAWLKAKGLRAPDWSDLHAVIEFSRLADLVGAEEALDESASQFSGLVSRLDALAAVATTPVCVPALRLAVEMRDPAAYAEAHARLERLHRVKAQLARRDALFDRLTASCRNLADVISRTADDPEWDRRMGALEEAWTWADTSEWVRSLEREDANALQSELTRVEDAIRTTIEGLAANRAWSHALAPSRMTGQTRADLAHYVQLVRQLGKGTGKYAAKRRVEIREAMDRCRSAVPVWIMPIYRVVDQLEIAPDMFDVVIVDEASQAGMEATFLQYVAPKIVVIGDDQQVSPSGVGLDQQELRDLAQQFLADDRYKSSWQDPGFSFFDAAVKYFGDRVTLTEHRRCMPEIIAFSNRIVYEPQNMRLNPVRQFGADRLEPVRAVHVPEGYEVGRSNPVEAEAIVEQVEKCLADPDYDGKTFGVISLLGGDQAKKIQNLLLDRIAPEELEAREMRCGDASDFQGSERDVMFLSMVKAPEPGRRIPAQTRRDVVQRYNVAASRAKDQMWVFHSMAMQELSGNPEDMRTALLEHCYSTMAQVSSADEAGTISAVPDDIPTEPFDSLFEQRVFNRIRQRGFSVTPQWAEQGYRIDLVVHGAKGRLAVECDGDFWHGRDAYERDLGRQRDLERCGWRFFRIRESEFYVDREEVLGRLWAKLDELEIRPAGWLPASPPETALVDLAETPEGSLLLDEPDIAEDVRLDEFGLEPEVGLAESEPVLADGPDQADSHEVRDSVASTKSPWLTEYAAFTGSVAAVAEASRPQIVNGLVEIVAAEGPIVGTHLYRRYVTSSGGFRVTRALASELNKAVHAALRNRLIVADAPLGEVPMVDRTYRLPTQPEWLLRTLGDRELELIPPAELAQLMELVVVRDGSQRFEPVARGVLAELGRTRLTAGVEARLREIVTLVSAAIE